ncbi:MAG: 7-cyano-7-deazaguanine synthase [Candidatus Eiseniibacteriota bacterium]|nr:MAG: 7-cyano-7-deazaguanine synthase [Candidatus Eisenbacteria bacterium]
MKRKAIALLSGGLDSTLAANLMKQQGIEIVALSFVTPFCQCSGKGGCGSRATEVARSLGVELRVEALREEYLDVVRSPARGYGKNMNPCIDCRILMFSRARELMEREGASFVFTGEVLGERPMSQRRDSMRVIEKESGLEGRLLRPLSAGLLPPTEAEEKGIVDRSKLLSVSGRSRKPQMKLAQQMGVSDYPCPAGGCLLTDPAYARKVKDLVEHGELTMKNVNLLRAGRHYRLADGHKLVVGRNEGENKALESMAEPGDFVFSTLPIPGPVALLRGGGNGSLESSARICASHSDAKQEKRVPVNWRKASGGQEGVLDVSPLAPDELKAFRIE